MASEKYELAIEYIASLKSVGIVPGLERIKELLRRFDNPQDKLSVIHVAGTNGKGSICAFLEYGLRECNLKVGRYISPTLFTYLERFQINGNLMSEEEFARLLFSVKNKCDEMLKDGFGQPTAFEIETVIAFLYALEQQVDVFILECGMGGLEDATNVVERPLATVFASISFDHQRFLGDTIEEIAKNKAGIMRPLVPAIFAPQPYPVVEYLQSVCDRNVPYFTCDRENFDIYDITKIKKPLDGDFQWDNLMTAILVFDVIKNRLSENLDLDTFVRGVEKTVWAGRFEKVCDNPVIIRDGAHNIDAVNRLAKELTNKFPNGIHLVMGVYKDKAYNEMLKLILPHALSFTAVTAPNPDRALPAEELAQAARQIVTSDITISTAESVREAVKDKDPVIVFGSLSLAAELRDTYSI